MKYLLVLFLLIAPALYGKQKDAPKPASKDARGVAPQATTKAARPQEAPATLVMGTVEQWRVRAEERFPDLKAPGSEFSAAFERAYNVTQAENPQFLWANDWPLRLAEIVARQRKESKPGSLAVARG